MPRKLCWIEVDEAGKAKLPDDVLYDYNSPADFALKVLNAATDATEEVVEAVAELLDDVAYSVSANPKGDARFLLSRLASTPPNKETTDG